MAEIRAKQKRSIKKRVRRVRVSGMTATELAEAAGVTSRIVKYYVAMGLLPSPQFRGKRTVYVREHVLRLVLIRECRAHGMDLVGIRKHLDSMSPEELESQAAPLLTPTATHVDLADAPLSPGIPHAAGSIEIWQHLALVPGVNLLYRADASLEALTVVAEIRQRFAGSASGG